MTARRDKHKCVRQRVLARTAIATAMSLAVSAAYADEVSSENVSRAKIRLALDDVISSRLQAELTEQFDGRLAVNALIQSHPDPLFIALEERYQALPPFTQASEEIPERYIVEATVPERMMENARLLANNVSEYVPRVSSSIRSDNIESRESRLDDDGNPIESSRNDVIATVNPKFEYRKEQRKWHLLATYDYTRGRYFSGEEDPFSDHLVDVKWTRRLENRGELQVTGLYQDSHDRETRDPIEDFDSSLESQDLNYQRSLINVLYRRDTPRDRSRYNIYGYKEDASVTGDDLFLSGYQVDRLGIGGRYDWQLRRQMSLVGEVRYNDFDYDLAYRDNQHVRALAGTDMIFGRRIRASLRLGYEEKKFEKALVNDAISEPVWEAMFEWALRRKTRIQLETSRSIYELAATNSPIDTGKFNIQEWVRTSWKETWTDRLSTETTYTIRETDLVGRNNNQQARQFLVSANYQLSNRWRFAFDGAYTREEDDLGADLSRKTFTLRTDYSL